MNPPQTFIEVIVSATGETVVKTHGFTGSTCRQASAALERALGLVTAERLTPEFYQQQLNQSPIQQRLDQK